MSPSFSGVAAGVLIAMAGAGAAHAQQPARVGDTVLGELVVTAQRREQAAQDVGIALSVIGGGELAARGVTNINQLQNATPSLAIEPAFGGGAPQFRLRGVGFQDYASNNSPTVGVYVNEVAYPVPVTTQGLLFDIARVEVLRGPQGTLYGRNTTGGAINFITGKPTSMLSAGAAIEFGRFEALKAEAFVAGPIADGVRGRIALGTEQNGGFQHRREDGVPIGDADRIGGRGILELDLGAAAIATLDLHGGVDRSQNTAVYLLNPLVTRGGAGVRIPADVDHHATSWLISRTLARDTGLPLDARPGRDNHTYGASLNVAWGQGAVKLSSISAYDFLQRKEYGDWDSSQSVEADTWFGGKVKVWSQELRLSSDTDGPLQWVGGVYVARQRQREQFYSDFNDVFGTFGRVLFSQLVKSYSLFGQAEYAVTDQIKVIGGLRYEKETRALQGFGSAFGGAQALAPTDVDTQMTPLTGKLALEYRATTDVLLYASASRGVKSGGFTTYNTGNSSAIQPFKPEVIYAYEVGFKSDPAPNLRINGSAYFYDYKDQQVLSAVYGANGPVGRIVNAPRSEIWGGEVELTWKPAAGLSIVQSLGYTDGRYKDFFDLDVPASRAAGRAINVDKSGMKLPFVKVTYSGSVSYVVQTGDFLVTPEVNYSYRDDYPSWLGVKYAIPHYWLANANLTLAPGDGPWSAGLYVRNLFNQDYDVTRNFFTSADIAQPGRPRTYGVRLTYAY